jgi:serine/threonine protein phosphatase PrpC
MKIDFASITGKRKQNEDKHNIIKNIDGANPEYQNINYYGLYDGHGGKFVSNFLSEHLSRHFTDKRISYPLKKSDVNKLFNYTQKYLKEKYEKKATHVGSTCLIVIQYIKNGHEYLNIMNLGDSRCVISRNNIAIPLTKDHKPDKPEELLRITELGGMIVHDGYDWRIGDLSVSRAFGDLSGDPYIGHEPDIFEYTITSKDHFMIIACDGLWDIISNQDAVDFVLKHCYDIKTMNRKNDKINIAKKIADFANNNGSTDNISVIVVFFK